MPGQGFNATITTVIYALQQDGYSELLIGTLSASIGAVTAAAVGNQESSGTRPTASLLGNGITDLLLQAEERTDEVGQLRLRDQLKRLTLPTEMGERFQVMGFSRDVDMSAAFLLGDLTWRL